MEVPYSLRVTTGSVGSLIGITFWFLPGMQSRPDFGGVCAAYKLVSYLRI
jgi:hypothetical protein